MTIPMQKQLYGIGIFEEEILLQDFTGDGEKRLVVTPEQLMSFFRTGITFRPFPGLIWMKDDGSHKKYLITLPAGKRTILYRYKRKLISRQQQLPTMVVNAQIDADGKILNINVWGFSGSQLKHETVLYKLPLPNLSQSSMCLGSTERSFGNDIREAVERTIFDTPFNHHNDKVGREGLRFLDYNKKYSGRCPLRTLERIGKGRDILEEQ
ncbi:hypothetical protein [uncultured Desulfuromusa sp.]|uniref:hypothetical protein n=1 Tax=uncultured Desulfuromusa sp. TaxID=219183 RepID=UPI002AA64880|nr:hypothetical protein [uncultured Desulfuromusa sp.]